MDTIRMLHRVSSRKSFCIQDRMDQLALACPGTVPHRPDGKTETTCDTSKAESDICAVFHNPKLTHLVQLVDVERDGRIRPVPGMPAGSEKVINDILRLNASFLCDERRKTMAGCIGNTRRPRIGITD